MYTMGTVLRYGSAEQKQRYLPGIASGDLRLQAFGVTEPTTGSDTTQLKTRAEKQGDQYVVCLLYTSPSPRDQRGSRMPSSA